ncbi:MAG TPA: glycoside hydrolase family 32 protein [Anaerolineaceae bacterium]|nr:glycoside hydrolase family 32 protein [Anaerolineaceae bacterium]
MENASLENQARTRLPDQHRPAYHFLPEKNWMNDPNGLIQWKGQYHLFYQYNPNGPFHGTIHWGHAASQDLVHWQRLPVALEPTPGGPDEGGIWSGCAVDNHGVPTLIYTGMDPQGQQGVCLAASPDDLLHWEKHPANPVIPAPPPDLREQAQGQFRDPFVWREDGRWQMVIGSKIAGRGGAILRYRSDDLVHWDYLGILMAGDEAQRKPFWTGAMWECPNFFKLDGQSVLLFSVQTDPGELLYPVYYVGEEVGSGFEPSGSSILVHGNSFYAPQVMCARDGRVLMWGWLKESRRPGAYRQAGWAGVMSLPLALSLLPGGKMRIEPVEELKSLRREHWHFEGLDLGPDFAGLPGGLRGDCLEIEAVFEPGPSAEFGLGLLASPDGQEQNRLVYDCARDSLVVERDQSSLNPEVDREPCQAPLSLDADGALRLRVFLDRSVLEVFANQHTCLATRVYPTRLDSLGLDLFAIQGETKLKSLDVWRMESIWS